MTTDAPMNESTLAISDTSMVLIWIGVTLVLILIGAGIAVWVRRRFHANDTAAPETLSLHELRELHAQGGLSDDEFEALRDAAVRAHQGGVAAMKPSPKTDAVRAEPGVDLTGEPLPKPPEHGGENPERT